MPSQESERFVAALAAEIHRVRKRKKLSQEKLANQSGVDRATISRFERLERVPGILALYDLAQALETPLHKLVEVASGKSRG